MLVQFGNNWMKKIAASSNLAVLGIFFSSNYFQIGQHVVLLHIQIAEVVYGHKDSPFEKSVS